METERPEVEPARGSGGRVLAFSVRWHVLAILAGSVIFGLLVRFVLLTFDLPTDPEFIMPAVMTFPVAMTCSNPESFRHLGIVSAISMAAGTLAMICYLPLALHAQGLEFWPQRFMISLLGAALVILLVWVALRVLRRLGVPWTTAFSRKDRS